MGNYNEIMTRLVKLIEKAEIAQNGTEDIVPFRGYRIYKEDCSEFDDLLNTENVWYLLSTEEDPALKNVVLINLCKERIRQSNNNIADYQTLIELIKATNNRTASELVEYSGYYIPKEKSFMFFSLCRKLGVGPCIAIKDMAPGELKTVLKKNTVNKFSQVKRIKDYMLLNKSSQNRSSLSNNNKNNRAQNVVSRTQKAQSSERFINVPRTNKEFFEIINLGLNGQLTKDIVISYGTKHGDSAYTELLNYLSNFKIFSPEIITALRNEMLYKREIISIDEWVVFFAERKDLNLENMSFLVNVFGVPDYLYFVDELFKLGVIDELERLKLLDPLKGDNILEVANRIL